MVNEETGWALDWWRKLRITEQRAIYEQSGSKMSFSSFSKNLMAIRRMWLISQQEKKNEY